MNPSPTMEPSALAQGEGSRMNRSGQGTAEKPRFSGKQQVDAWKFSHKKGQSAHTFGPIIKPF